LQNEIVCRDYEQDKSIVKILKSYYMTTWCDQLHINRFSTCWIL